MIVMAYMVKWLTLRIVAPACAGSIPVIRPNIKILSQLRVGFFYSLCKKDSKSSIFLDNKVVQKSRTEIGK